jgi:hypothetical protein
MNVDDTLTIYTYMHMYMVYMRAQDQRASASQFVKLL